MCVHRLPRRLRIEAVSAFCFDMSSISASVHFTHIFLDRFKFVKISSPPRPAWRKVDVTCLLFNDDCVLHSGAKCISIKWSRVG